MLYYGIRNFKKTVNAFNNRKKMYRTEYLYFLKGGNNVTISFDHSNNTRLYYLYYN